MDLDPFLPLLHDLEEVERAVVSLEPAQSAHDKLVEISITEQIKKGFDRINVLLKEYIPDHWDTFGFEPNAVKLGTPITFGDGNRISALAYLLGYISYALSLPKHPLKGALKTSWASFDLPEISQDPLALEIHIPHLFKTSYRVLSLHDGLSQHLIDYIRRDIYVPTPTTPAGCFEMGLYDAQIVIHRIENDWNEAYALPDALENEEHIDGHARTYLKTALENHRSDPGNDIYIAQIYSVLDHLYSGKNRSYSVTSRHTAAFIKANYHVVFSVRP